MKKDDLEKLIMTEYLLELSRIQPAIKSVKDETELESFIENNFSKEQQAECFSKASVSIFDGLSKLVS